MSDFYTDRETIEQVISDSLDSAVPIVWENTRQGTPCDDIWIRVSVRPASTVRLEMPPCKSVETIGIVFIQIFTRIEEGTDKIEKTRSDIASFMLTSSYGDIEFRDLSHGLIGYDNPWYSANLNAEYRSVYVLE